MKTMQQTRGLRGGVLLLAAALLAACGGGGGGGGAPSTPETAATLDATRRDVAVANGVRAVEAPLLLAQLATDWVRRLARDGGLQLNQPCDNDGGTLQLSLTDADGNGRLSAGDRVDIVVVRCPTAADLLLGSYIGGRMTVRIATATDAAAGSISGELSVDDSFGERIAGDVPRRGMLGALQFERTNGLLQDRLQVRSSSAADLRFTITRRSNNTESVRADAYTQIDLTRAVLRETARIVVNGGLRNRSDDLAGWVDIAASPALESPMDTMPDRGRIVIRGAAGSRVTIASPPDSLGLVAVGLDANGDGQDEATTQQLWGRVTSGYLGSPSNRSQSTFPTVSPAMQEVLVPTVNSGGQDMSAPLLLQFNHPIVSPTALYALMTEDLDGLLAFQNGTDATLIDGPRTTSPADVEVRGALMIIRPRQPLRYGADYGVTLSTSSTPGPLDRVILGGGDGITPFGPFIGVSFRADPDLWVGVSGAGPRSILMPGRPVTLTAIAPGVKALPARFRWSQLSGPSVAFSDPDSASPTVTLTGAASAGLGRALLQVTVTDRNGRTASRPVEIQVGSTAGLKTFLYLASDKGDYIGGGAARLVTESDAAFSSSSGLGFPTVRVDAQNGAALWSLDFAAPLRAMPAAGVYTGATTQASWPDPIPYLWFSGDGRACSTGSGRFEVLELVPNAGGAGFSRLAVDFEQRCNGVSATLRGSLRIGSDIPVMP